MSVVDKFLEHYGVKGQKWGVRKSRSSRSSKSSTQRTRFSKAPSKLSDVELAKRIKRMETEKKYNELNRKDISAGKKFVADVLASSGRQVAKTVLVGSSLLAIKTALSAKLGEDAGGAVTRRLK